ncbi:MAG: hypothetical protein ACI8S6_000438 [Myxococcota bacterium]|jgi:hypothetical protein
MKPARKVRDPRDGLKISATTATLFALFGHWLLGFEQTLLQLLVAILAGYSAALLFEWVDARANGRPPAFVGGGRKGLILFLLPAHMTAVTTSFLLYVNEHLWVMVFAVVAGIGSKFVFKVTLYGRKRHFMNPSNFGIAITLLLFHWVAVIPYEYTEGLHGTFGAGDWILPAAIVILGTNLNIKFTRRIPLILAFLSTFSLQATLRSIVLGTPFLAGFMPMTGVAFLLFSFYMITDPMTSPSSLRNQIIFGSSVAIVYLLLMLTHVVFTLFFAVSIVCACRGALIAAQNWRDSRASTPQPLTSMAV